MAIAILQGVGGKVPQDKSIKIEKDGDYIVEADEGFALDSVAIEVDTPDKKPEIEWFDKITANGVYNPTIPEGKVISRVLLDIDVPEEKPEEELNLGIIKTNGAREVYPSAGSVFSKVTFEVDIDRGTEQFDNRLDGIIALQKGFIEGEPKPSEGLEYRFSDFYQVIGRGTCTDSVIVIPSTYDDGVNGEHLVKSIGYNDEYVGAFNGDQLLEELVLPESGVTFDAYQFDKSSLRILRNFCGTVSFALYGLSLEYVSFLPDRDITNYEFTYMQVSTYDFSRNTRVSVLTDAEYISVAEDTKIIVPANLVDEWKSASNWTAYADHIVAADEVSDYNTTEERLEVIEGNVPKVYEAGEEVYKGDLRALIDGSLTELVIPDGVTKLRSDIFYECRDLTSIVIPDSVTSIGHRAFYRCSSLMSIVIPDSVTSIGADVFSSCSSLTSVELPNGITKLENNTFYYCSSLTSIKIPKSVTSISNYVFLGCSQCILYDFSSHTSVPTIQSTAFQGINAEAKIYVPSVLYDEWIAATNWVTYKDYIVSVDVKSEPNINNFNVYVGSSELVQVLDNNYLTNGVGKYEIRNDGSIGYVRVYGDGKSGEAFATVPNMENQVTGKYLVYAYRLPASNYASQHYFQIYANTTGDTPSGKGDMFYVKTQKDGKWHVDVIDIEAAINSSSSVVVSGYSSKFTPINGQYIAKKLRFDWFNETTPASDYIDIAYIGLCDNIDRARAADPDYTGAEFSPEYLAYKLGCGLNMTESGMLYAMVSSTTNSSGESWVWLSENSDQDYRIIPNTTMYVGILYAEAPGKYGEIYACSDSGNLTNSSWRSLGRIDPYDTSSGWHFGIIKFKAPLADAACRLMRFDFFNGLNANSTYSMNIAFVKCFASEEEANAYYQEYRNKYNI